MVLTDITILNKSFFKKMGDFVGSEWKIFTLRKEERTEHKA
jgi:hypothetical protein